MYKFNQGIFRIGKTFKLESQKNKPWFSIKSYFQSRFEKSKLGFELLMFYYV